MRDAAARAGPTPPPLGNGGALLLGTERPCVAKYATAAGNLGGNAPRPRAELAFQLDKSVMPTEFLVCFPSLPKAVECISMHLLPHTVDRRFECEQALP